MLGLLQGIGWKLTCARYAIEDAVTQVKFKNYIEKRQKANNVEKTIDEAVKKNSNPI